MISFEEAYRIVVESARPMLSEQVDFARCVNRVLAQDLMATMDMPPFDKSMVDGYACRREDLSGGLEVLETIPAGREPERSVGQGQCAKIMTGAMVPAGADCVFMVEVGETSGNGVVRFTGDGTNDNIVLRGHDVERGDLLLQAGHRIGPQDVAVMASMGHIRPQVYCQPSVAVIATGDELVEPELEPGIGQIRNSNAYHLRAQLESLGLSPVYEGIARDDEDALVTKIGNALMNNEVLLISGGVSMGDYDFVPGVLEKLGIDILFDRVAIQPGKPTVFGFSELAYCFGLPGNPVSSYVVFEVLVKPFLYKLMDHVYTPPVVMMPLGEAFSRKSGAREGWVPVILTRDGMVHHVNYHGSGHINALSHADALARIPKGVTELERGSLVSVRLIRT